MKGVISTIKAVLLVLTIFLSLASSARAKLFFATSAQSQSIPSSSITADGAQIMPLLTAGVAMMSNLKAVDADSEIHIEDGEALIADIGSAGTLADAIDIPITDTISVYTVVPGDTVAKVAALSHVSENTIRWANGLGKTDVLHVGQKLTILPITGVKHRVIKGDTLQTIAKRYKADATDIAEFNNMEVTDGLMIGDLVIVPNGEITITKVVVDKKTGKKKTVEVTGTGLKGGVSVGSGYYIRPVNLGSGIQKTQGFHTRYNAVDIGAPKGTPIHAMADGTVIVAKSSGYNGGYGLLIIIQHANGSQTLYAHQSRVDVTVGQRVSQGEVIGAVGNTGLVHGRTGLHLHFEIRGVYPTPVLY